MPTTRGPSFADWLASKKDGVVVERRLRDLWLLNDQRFTIDDASYRHFTIGALVEFSHLQGIMDRYAFEESGCIPGPEIPVQSPPGTLATIRSLEEKWRRELAAGGETK